MTASCGRNEDRRCPENLGEPLPELRSLRGEGLYLARRAINIGEQHPQSTSARRARRPEEHIGERARGSLKKTR
jgi:hypothetical protein